jgi:putative sterol carrier protein
VDVVINASAEFFRELGDAGREPLLEKAAGSIRFDLVDGTHTDRWLVTLDRGDVSVTRKKVAADCVVRADRALFDAIASGEVNAMASLLRGELTYEGDPALLVLLQRVFPAPATQAGNTGGGSDPR